MCTLLIWKHRHPEYPVVIAANRDEFEGRPASDPMRLGEQPLVVGGRDEQALGTWLAVSEHGIVVALTNRHDAGKHDPAKRSRGQLVLDLARRPTLADIRAALRAIAPATYNPFVLVAVSADDGIVAQSGDDGLTLLPVSDGVHAVTNWDFDDPNHPKARRALDLASAFDLDADDAQTLATRLHALLTDHLPGPRGIDGGLCVHRPDEGYGTRSSAIVMLDGSGGAKFFYVPGHPCEGRLQDVSALLVREDSTRAHVER